MIKELINSLIMSLYHLKAYSGKDNSTFKDFRKMMACLEKEEKARKKIIEIFTNSEGEKE